MKKLMKKTLGIGKQTHQTRKVETKKPQESVLQKFDSTQISEKKKTILIVLGIIFAGIISGYLLSSLTSKGMTKTDGVSSESKDAKMVVGSKDTKTFRDSAEGELEEGGFDGEGTHKLIRPGGESQTVYLTSSVLDLNEFVGKKVRVWGETFAAKKAAWLMDVGRVEVLE